MLGGLLTDLKKTIKPFMPLWFIRFVVTVVYKIKDIIINLPLSLIINFTNSLILDIPLSWEKYYSKWLIENYPRQSDLDRMSETVNCLKYQPVISIIMHVFNSPQEFLEGTIESVVNQVYPYWELCIADDASTNEYIKPLLEECMSSDPRIKVVFRNNTGHISACSNSALELVTGEFIALLDQDDLLTPDALYQVVIAINKHPNVDMLYSDEDRIGRNNRLSAPFFKPDWCPDSFLSRMYSCHLGIYRVSLVREIGGFRFGYEGSQDYDLVLRLTEKTNQIVHIPKVLYHWRIHPNSTSVKNEKSKDYAFTAAQRAVSDALERRREPGTVISTSRRYLIVRYEILEPKKVSIIIPTKNFSNVLNNCLTSIFEKTQYDNYEVLVIDNGSTEAEALEVLKYWKTTEAKRFEYKHLDIPFNFSRINNYAVNHTTGDYLLFLNNDTEVITLDWLNAMVEQVQRQSIGAVGALLLYPDDTIQHAGVTAGVGGVAGHSHKYFKAYADGYFSQIQTINNYSAVTGACLMCRRSVFEEVGGFEEELSVAFNDVDLCFKMVEKGYRNIYLPHVRLYHYESKSRGADNIGEKEVRFRKENLYMQNRWKDLIENDPCYSPHLTRKYEDFSIRLD
ncbi:glycosyltransferase [Pseudanabaena sp. PCC 6802]|uniref:glycosyltransferase n=1 Tax=Pseudanabaena sp. PCC 6802 TaxID=118173 RepID=UPI000349D71C|nr:glycosyltransferase [Pseudanabaena sp. PCC 6802]